MSLSLLLFQAVTFLCYFDSRKPLDARSSFQSPLFAHEWSRNLLYCLHSHIRPQYLRDNHTSVLLLVIFEDRHKCAAYRQAGAIQCMDKLCTLFPFSLESYIRSSCLEISEIRARGNLPVLLLGREPDLKVICLCSSKP